MSYKVGSQVAVEKPSERESFDVVGRGLALV